MQKLITKSFTIQIDDNTALSISEIPDRTAVDITITDPGCVASVRLNKVQLDAFIDCRYQLTVCSKPVEPPTRVQPEAVPEVEF